MNKKTKQRKNMRTNDKVYGLFYKDHGNWRATGNRVTLKTAQTIKNRVKKSLKSKVIIRKVQFV